MPVLNELNAMPETDFHSTIVLTDSPEVVALKREFRFLDEREEQLKRMMHHAAAREELELVRQRKAEIATLVFKAQL